MKISFRTLIIPLVLFVSISPGCVKLPPPLTLSEADQKFTNILQKEFHYKPVVRMSGKTLWVYLPGEREIFTYTASKSAEQNPKKKFSVEYLDGKFEDSHFVIDYDIISAFKAAKDTGLSSSYTERFNEEYRNVFGALARSYVDTQTPPDFIGIVFADIKSGLEVINIFCTDDFKQYQSSAMPYDEYLLRAINETKGDKAVIGDWEGKSFDFKEMTWTDFLARQIINRINFKYQKSDFAPEEDAVKEIIKIIYATVSYYRFTEFVGAKITDLRNNTTRTFEQWELFKLSK